MWCDDGQYPRELTEMVGGKAEQRCACFEQPGWSNLRKVYPACEPSAHRCKLLAEEDAPAQAAGGPAHAHAHAHGSVDSAGSCSRGTGADAAAAEASVGSGSAAKEEL